MNDLTIEERIAAKTDLTIAGATAVSSEVGGLSFKDMGQVMEFAKLMAVAGQAVPKHLRAAPGACLAVSLQALNWRMDPFAVANKSYAVNDRIAYEAQLIHAVIEQRAPIKGRIKGAPEGEGQKRKWRLWCETDDGDRIDYEGPEIGNIKTKNSPLWTADPDQQLWYYSVRAMCRRHFPDVILGVYEKEELASDTMRDVTPEAQRTKPNLAQRLAAPSEPAPEPQGSAPQGDVIDRQAREVEAEDADAEAAFIALAAEGGPGSMAWDKGVAAFEDGQPITACSYDPDETKTDAEDWCAGWVNAERAKA